MSKIMSCLLVLAALLLPAALPHFAAAQEGDTMPGIGDLEPNAFTELAPGGDTACATGTPYAFYVRPADPNKLLIFLGGGGGCWSFETCDLASSPTYDPFVDASDDLTLYGGIVDLDNPENPFAEYSMVGLPACTADNHMGHRATTYQAPATDGGEAREVTIFHYGFVDAMAALDWTFANFDHPTHIFVAGSSSGGIAAPFFGGLIAEHYPDAQIAVLGDSSGGSRFGAANAQLMESWATVDVLPDWPEYEGATVDSLPFERYFIASANHFPDMVFAQYNTANDETQRFFLQLMGVTGPPLLELLQANQTEIREAVPGNFFTYTAGGSKHVILPFSEFYTYQVNGVRFRDWVAALAAGEAVEDVACTDCDVAELYSAE